MEGRNKVLFPYVLITVWNVEPKMHRAAHISRGLKLRHLNVLLAVAQWGNMARAAEHLAISQPTVSKAIADLENTLGVRLLDRRPRGLELTLYGRAFLKRSIAIFNDLGTSVTELESLADPTAGELRIGTTVAMAAGLVYTIVDRLSRAVSSACFSRDDWPSPPPARPRTTRARYRLADQADAGTDFVGRHG